MNYNGSQAQCLFIINNDGWKKGLKDILFSDKSRPFTVHLIEQGSMLDVTLSLSYSFRYRM